jgi:hypothetical protein
LPGHPRGCVPQHVRSGVLLSFALTDARNHLKRSFALDDVTKTTGLPHHAGYPQDCWPGTQRAMHRRPDLMRTGGGILRRRQVGHGFVTRSNQAGSYVRGVRKQQYGREVHGDGTTTGSGPTPPACDKGELRLGGADSR